jgi:hypothetical protein
VNGSTELGQGKIPKTSRPLPGLNTIALHPQNPVPVPPLLQVNHNNPSASQGDAGPALGDDSFIVEAPSFTLPYLYENYVNEKPSASGEDDPKKEKSYFEQPVGRFLLDLGTSLVQEFIGEETLRVEKRKLKKGRDVAPGLAELVDKMEQVQTHFRSANGHLKTGPVLRCKTCYFRTTSATVLDAHYECPHVVPSVPGLFGCNFCQFTSRSLVELQCHFFLEHKKPFRLEKADAKFQCGLCPWEDKYKPRYLRHVEACEKKFVAEKNCDVSGDWEMVAKNSVPLALQAALKCDPVNGRANYPQFHFLMPKDHVKAASAIIAASLKAAKQSVRANKNSASRKCIK